MEFISSLNARSPSIARAIVRSNQDPSKMGRVRVEYPWFAGDSSRKPSEWARVCLPYASGGHGAWFLPEVGDECLVFFENGSLDSPIVVGSLYNGKNAPPASDRPGSLNDDNKNSLRYIKTRSGHTLCFDDADKGAVILKDRENRRVEISTGDKKVIVSDDKGNRLEIEQNKVTVKHHGGSHVTLENDKVVIHGSSKIELGEGAAHAVIKGDLFQQIFNAHTHSTSVGPTSPPQTPMTPDMLSQRVKTS